MVACDRQDHVADAVLEHVTMTGEYVREKAYHSEPKGWVNGFYLKTHMFSEESLLDQKASHWLNPRLL